MRGRFAVVIAGFALAVGGGIAGATLSQSSPEPASLRASFDPTAAQRAIEAGRVALHNVGHALLVAQRARRISRTARGKARRAQATANNLVDEVNDLVRDLKDAADDASRALTRASTALDRSSAALDASNAVGARLDSTRTVSKTEASSVSTSETSEYTPLGGPQIAVTVPASGLIQVWATVRFGPPTDGAVALYEDGQRVPVTGQDTNCTIGGLDDALMVVESTINPSGAMTVSTPPAELSFAGAGCGTLGGAPGPMLFERSPGTHTYELRYGDCGCDEGQSAAFSNRTLRVTPLP